MHSFKVVAILKKWGNKTRMEYSYVPYKWEQNGILKWPNENATKLRQDAASEPQLGWIQFQCKLKRNLIMSLDEAELWENELISANNTDAEENIVIPPPIKKLKMMTSSIIRNGSEYDAMLAEASAKVPALSSVSVNSSTHNAQVAVVGEEVFDLEEVAYYNNSLADTPNILNNIDDFLHPKMPVQNNTTEQNDSTEQSNITLNDAIVKILDQQNLLFNEMQSNRIDNEREFQKNRNELQAVKLTVDTIYKLLKKSNQNPVQSGSLNDIPKADDFADKFEFPLQTVEEISKFNQEMLNTSFKEYLINKYSSIGGETGNDDGKIVAKKLAELFFTTHVLTLCSWTGVSRTKNVEKKTAFQTFEEILNLFFILVRKADSRWTANLNENFFKTKTLRHATQTNNAKNKKNTSAVESTDPETTNNGNENTELHDCTAATMESTHDNSIAIVPNDNIKSTEVE